MLAAQIMQSKWKEEWPELSIENFDIFIADGAWCMKHDAWQTYIR